MKNIPVFVICHKDNGPLFQGAINGGAVMAHAYKDSQSDLTVRYEPAVPRCATCEHYQFVAANTDEESGMTCESGAMVILDLPQNGSGYCHNHSALK